MSESDAPAEKKELRCIPDVLRTIIGRVATVSNPESLEPIPLGHQIKPNSYRAKILNVYDDMVVVAIDTGKGGQKAPARQFISVSSVKRVCMLKDDIHLHL